MATAPAYRTAIHAIGKAMGDSKFDNHMGGAMIPRSDLDPAVVLALLYKKPVASVRRKLSEAEEERFKRNRQKAMRK